MGAFDANVLAEQLGQLGRDLDAEVKVLGELEKVAVEAQGLHRRLEVQYAVRVDEALLKAQGAVEVRKATARLDAVPAKLEAEEQWRIWQLARTAVETQEKSLSALHKRIDIGRSLLSREKALIGLAGIGET